MDRALDLDILSLALLCLAATSYARRRLVVLLGAGALFFPAAGAATWFTCAPVSPALAVVLMVLTLGVSLGVIVLFLVDVIFAPFCLQMTYFTFVCWVLCSQLVAVNFAFLLARHLAS